MTQDEIIRMARKAGGEEVLGEEGELMIFPVMFLPKFAALVAEATKEKAAKVCEEEAERHEESSKYEEDADYKMRFLVYAKHIRTCAAAIRSMK